MAKKRSIIKLNLKIIHQFFFMLNYFFYDDEYVNPNKAIINNNELINN